MLLEEDYPKILVPDRTKHFPLELTTLADLFKAAGYMTARQSPPPVTTPIRGGM